jgi:hypothetical protein
LTLDGIAIVYQLRIGSGPEALGDGTQNEADRDPFEPGPLVHAASQHAQRAEDFFV